METSPKTLNQDDIDLSKFESYIKFYKSESLRFKSLINSAKTSYKKSFYMKKLKENNELLGKCLYLYDKVIKSSNQSSQDDV